MYDDPQFSELDSPGQAAGTTRLEWLQQQERVWFGWVCRLHDVHSGSETPNSGTVLAIAQRRWADARQALEREAQSQSESLRRETRQQFANRLADRSR